MRLIVFPFLFLFVFSNIIEAKSLQFTTDKTSLELDEDIKVSASVSGFSHAEQLYIKGVFFKEGSSNYFGYTKFNDTWVKNSTKTKDQRKVAIGEWDGSVIAKPDYLDSGFSDNGVYKFKIGYYTLTAEGEPSSVHWSDTIVDITLTKPQPTATMIPSSTPIPASSTPIPTQTKVPTVSPSNTLKPTKSMLLSPTQKPEVLAVQITEIPSIASSSKQISNNKVSVVIPLVFVGLGTGLLSLVFFIPAILKHFSHKKEEE